MDTLEKGRNMKKVGILGGTGEIGKRVVKLLENQYELLVSYHSVKPSVTAHNQYIQLDVDISDDLENFCSQCSIIVNCAGASFVNGEKIARAAAKYHIPVVDPSGEAFLEDRIADIENESVYVLSSGFFPGMTGLLMKYLCESLKSVDCIMGLSITNEIPSRSAIKDFILTNTAGFGTALNYYENGELKRDETPIYRIVENKEYTLQNYYTIELQRITQKYKPERANWYYASFGEEITKLMQEAVIKYGLKQGDEALQQSIDSIIKLFEMTGGSTAAYNYIHIEVTGSDNNQGHIRTADVHSSYSSDISSIIAAYTVKALVEKQPDFGIHYAMDIVDLETVIHDLPQLNIDLVLTDKILEKEETYEEGSI